MLLPAALRRIQSPLLLCFWPPSPALAPMQTTSASQCCGECTRAQRRPRSSFVLTFSSVFSLSFSCSSLQYCPSLYSVGVALFPRPISAAALRRLTHIRLPSPSCSSYLISSVDCNRNGISFFLGHLHIFRRRPPSPFLFISSSSLSIELDDFSHVHVRSLDPIRSTPTVSRCGLATPCSLFTRLPICNDLRS